MTSAAPAVLTEFDTVDEQGEAILVILNMLTIVGSFNNVDYVDKWKIEKYVFLEIVQIKIIKVRKVTKPIVNRDENEMHDYVIISGGAEIVRGHRCIAGGAG